MFARRTQDGAFCVCFGPACGPKLQIDAGFSGILFDHVITDPVAKTQDSEGRVKSGVSDEGTAIGYE